MAKYMMSMEETHVYELEVDNEQYPLEQLGNYNMYQDQEPPAKPAKMKKQEAETSVSEDIKCSSPAGIYRQYKDADIEMVFIFMKKG